MLSIPIRKEYINFVFLHFLKNSRNNIFLVVKKKKTCIINKEKCLHSSYYIPSKNTVFCESKYYQNKEPFIVNS